MKILPVVAELFHADGGTVGRTERQTDMTKIIVAFCNSENAPETFVLTHTLFTTLSTHF